jgi:DNA-binding CsgD family transcriptional regulator
MTNHRIAILEPSHALGYGLSKILGKSCTGFTVTGVYRDITSFRIAKTNNIDIILINPLLVDFHATVRDNFPQNRTSAFLVAIPYGFINDEALKCYDGTLNLFDDGASLVQKLKTIVGLSKTGPEDQNEDIKLTARELDVIKAVASGLKSREIAEKLNMSIHTVISHRNKIASKIGFKGAAGLAAYAHLRGLTK